MRLEVVVTTQPQDDFPQSDPSELGAITIMSNIPRQSRVLPTVSALCAAALRAAAHGAAHGTQSDPTQTGLAVTKVLGALLLLLPLAACTDHDIKHLLLGDDAKATVEQPTPYMTGSTLTEEQLNRLKNYAPGQTTMELRHLLKAPDSYTQEGDFYRTADGRMVKIPYDSAGRWTGQVEQVETPAWTASPYPGSQP